MPERRPQCLDQNTWSQTETSYPPKMTYEAFLPPEIPAVDLFWSRDFSLWMCLGCGVVASVVASNVDLFPGMGSWLGMSELLSYWKTDLLYMKLQTETSTRKSHRWMLNVSIAVNRVGTSTLEYKCSDSCASTSTIHPSNHPRILSVTKLQLTPRSTYSFSNFSLNHILPVQLL